MRATFVIISFVFVTAFLHSQNMPGTWEFSLSGTMGSFSLSTESSISLGTPISSSESYGYLSLAIRPGLFIAKGFEFEPEIFWTAMKDQPPALNLSGNLAYNFTISNSRLSPFLLAGYGVGNAVPIFQRVFARSSDKFDIPLLNVGAGLKYYFSDWIALRTEYRYQRYSWENSYASGAYSSTMKYAWNFHNVFVGFSVFLP